MYTRAHFINKIYLYLAFIFMLIIYYKFLLYDNKINIIAT